VWTDIADAKTYWITRIVFQRGLGLTCLIAFLCALNQYRPLVGERGLLPVPIFVRQVPFKESPSLFFWLPKDGAFAAAAWAGIVLSCLVLTGVTERYGSWLVMAVWAAIYVLYLSFVNVGQTFYSFGWESILLEACFFSMFLGSNKTANTYVADAVVALPNHAWSWIDQVTWRPLLAQSHLPQLALRNAADAKPAQLVLPLDARMGA